MDGDHDSHRHGYTRPVPTARCTWHPDRPGVAVCVDCRRVVCPDCATVVDGLHCCVDCLPRRAAAAPMARRRAPETWTAGAALATLSWWGLLTLVVWGLSVLSLLL